MGIDKPTDNVHRLEKERNLGDRVFIKRDLLEKYVREVEVPQEDINKWREDRKEAAAWGEDKESSFLDSVPHPKAELVSTKQLFITEKMPGKYKLAPLMNSNRFVWVDSRDVEDNPLYNSGEQQK